MTALLLLAACEDPELDTPDALDVLDEDEEWLEPRAASATGTFFIEGTTLKDPSGYPFKIRGVNVPFAWWETQVPGELATVAARGANLVRITLDKDLTSAADLQTILNAAKASKLVAMLYLTDFTGSSSDADLNGSAGAVAWWTSTGSYATNGIKAVLTSGSYKPYILINIANEWMGPWGQGAAWKSSYKTAVTTMRAQGLSHTLVIDTPGYGQDDAAFKGHGAQLRAELNASSTGGIPNGKNIMFSHHLYDSFYDATTVRRGLDTCLQSSNGVADLPCLVGEFGDLHHRTYTCPDGQPAGSYCNVDEASIMLEARKRRLGYIGWSWAKNNAPINVGLDMLTNFAAQGGTNTTWGTRLFTGADGLSQTMAPASLWGEIQAEDFIAASEPNAVQSGSADDVQRCRNALATSVDIGGDNAARGGCAIGWIDANESWDYEVKVVTGGNQTLKVRTGTPLAGKTLHVYVVSGATEYFKGTITIPVTGGYSTYQWTSLTVNEPNTGLRRLRLRTSTGGFKFDALTWN